MDLLKAIADDPRPSFAKSAVLIAKPVKLSSVVAFYSIPTTDHRLLIIANHSADQLQIRPGTCTGTADLDRGDHRREVRE